MEQKQNYTITIYTENSVGLLNRISTIFLKRHISIESINSSKSEIEEVYKIIIVVNTTEQWTKRIVSQIEKQVDVIRAYYHTEDEIIYEESVMLKVASEQLFEQPQVQNVIKENRAKIVTVNRDFFVISMSGRSHEIDKIYQDFRPFGIKQFVRSGRLSVTKSEMPVSELLKQYKKR